jgi:outer membrane protein
MRSALLLLALCIGIVSSAAASELQSFFAALDDHPALRASRAGREAVQLQLAGLRGPVALQARYGYAALWQDELALPDELPDELREIFEELFPSETQRVAQLELSVTFRPFLFGDLADAEAQAEIELQRAVLAEREARAQLEAQALESAQRLKLAEAGLALAERGLALAERAVEVTRTRFERGGATPGELRDVERALQDAQAQRARAEREADLAARALADLVGPMTPPALPTLPRLTGTPLAVQRAQLDLALAEVGARNAGRALWPTAFAAYSYTFEGDRSTLSLSIESRTLQPRLEYRYQSEAGLGLESLNRSSLQLGISLELSDATFAAAAAAERQQSAAAAGLELAMRQAELEQLALESERQHAQAQLTLARQAARDAQAALEEADIRVGLGVATELERDQAALALKQALLNAASAELALLSSQLAFYRFYSVPLSAALAEAERQGGRP